MSHSRTGIHGGLRRGSAAAAIGVVLVLSAGVPASQADGGPDSGDPDVRVTGSAELPQLGGLLEGLLGATGTVPASPQPTPVPGPTSASPSPVPTTAAPAPTTVSPSPTTSSSSAATGSPQEVVTAPVPSPQQPRTAGSQPGTLPAGPGSAPQTPEALAAEQSAASQPAAGVESPAATQPAASEPSAAASRASGTGTLQQAAGGPARGRQEVAPARDAEPAGVSAKVWVGVGLVGSAGAAGLILTRIRRI